MIIDEKQTMHKCAICGKRFDTASMPEYIYRIGNKWYCGWNHYRQAQEKKQTRHYIQRGAKRKEYTRKGVEVDG